MNDAETRISQKKRIRIGKTNIFGCKYAQASRYEKRILAAVKHPCHPVNRSIGIRTADRLDKSRNDVVMHLPILVIHGHIVLQTGIDKLICYCNRGVRRHRIHYNFKYVEQFACIASALAQNGFGLLKHNIAVPQVLIFPDGPVEQCPEVIRFKRLEHKYLTTRKKGSDHFK